MGIGIGVENIYYGRVGVNVWAGLWRDIGVFWVDWDCSVGRGLNTAAVRYRRCCIWITT